MPLSECSPPSSAVWSSSARWCGRCASAPRCAAASRDRPDARSSPRCRSPGRFTRRDRGGSPTRSPGRRTRANGSPRTTSTRPEANRARTSSGHAGTRAPAVRSAAAAPGGREPRSDAGAEALASGAAVDTVHRCPPPRRRLVPPPRESTGVPSFPAPSGYRPTGHPCLPPAPRVPQGRPATHARARVTAPPAPDEAPSNPKRNRNPEPIPACPEPVRTGQQCDQCIT